MSDFSFKEYSPSLSDKSKAEEIYNKIKGLDPMHNQIIIDFDGLIAMTTICARIIFGRLYKEMGAKLFVENIQMKNLEDTVRIVIKWGISKELELN
jgi:hypothetical protein